MFVDGVKRMISIVRIALLVIPFTIAYESSISITVIQRNATKSLGLLDASVMKCFSPIFVLVFGYLVGNIPYPFLAKCIIKISTTHKFAYGTIFGALFFGWSWLIDYLMKDAYFNNDKSQLSILYQIPPYMFFAGGEIFAISASYEIAFAIAPKEQKTIMLRLESLLDYWSSRFHVWWDE